MRSIRRRGERVPQRRHRAPNQRIRQHYRCRCPRRRRGAIAARGWLTENAEKTIDIQYFIYSTDHVGLIASDFILRAAKRGVKVRLLVDDLLIEDDGIFLQALARHPNIEIKIYNPNFNIGKSLSDKLINSARDFEVSTNGCITRHSSLMVK